MKKRSITIAGHATSITLEDEFWTELQRIAAVKQASVAALVREVDAKRDGNLSSALRIYVLKWLRDPPMVAG